VKTVAGIVDPGIFGMFARDEAGIGDPGYRNAAKAKKSPPPRFCPYRVLLNAINP